MVRAEGKVEPGGDEICGWLRFMLSDRILASSASKRIFNSFFLFCDVQSLRSGVRKAPPLPVVKAVVNFRFGRAVVKPVVRTVVNSDGN